MSEKRPEAFDLKLERVALGEVTGSGSSEEKQALEALAQSSRLILDELPVDDVLREVERRRRVALATQEGSRPPRLYFAIAGVAVACAILFMLLRTGSDKPDSDLIATHQAGDPYASHGETRSKGDARLLVHLQTEEGSAELHDGDSAQMDDRLQLSYLAAGQRYGVIVSLDGRETVTLHLPESPGDAVLLAQDKQALDSSYQLDDAPKFERFYFVTSNAPFSAEMVVKAATAASATQQVESLELEGGFQQYVFTVRKVQP